MDNVALLAEGVDRNTLTAVMNSLASRVALLAEGVDRNILKCPCKAVPVVSPSSRRAWIEIVSTASSTRPSSVALLAEGVDRNPVLTSSGLAASVALLAEGVDRNQSMRNRCTQTWRSPSSRRAWIEICKPCPCRHSGRVALLAEGVDRNGQSLRQEPLRKSRPPRGGRG